ncbi:phosphoglycerate kinase [Mesohalobacter halotolerans]|uniref:Phosphoglycerate kinase n=1 Tax=Mesohalobacter halotolerans TaxID=1883405 RepID=A0A4V6AME6_9FLAO|nr:phosphoglycerate kinase [Mesohalobacter halotolerans]MBS3738409.1 phosphoglycerate kinase [Psychroflexus sp.]TKS57355.1 phosphoglycerate kinase [Mesohalobacter halotolerans]
MNSIDDINFEDKKAIIRVDFNVPLNENFEVTDKSRIEGAKPSIVKVLEDGGSAILMSHLGRPNGVEDKFSLKHIVNTVSEEIGVKVKFVEDSVGEAVQKAAEELQNGEVLLLENLRFHPEEKAGDETFAKQLADLADVYVNDAFGTAHRAHASTTVVAKFAKEKAMGYLLKKEIDSLDKVLNSKEKPVTAIIGGAKVSSKITVIENILDAIDHLIIGGGMAFTFIKAKGGKIGESLVEDDKQDVALKIMKMAEQKNVKVHLPIDSKTTKEFKNDSETKIQPIDNIEEGWMGLDAGPKSQLAFAEVIKTSKIILWNGPLGVFEMPNFAEGTIAAGNAIAEATANGAFSLVGGGDSVSAVKQNGFEDKVSYVSTGGGAMLEMLEGKTLPGVAALDD